MPGPLPFSRFVVTEQPATVVAPPAAIVAEPPVVAERPIVAPPTMASPPRGGIVTTGYSTVRSCFTDLAGIERCY